MTNDDEPQAVLAQRAFLEAMQQWWDANSRLSGGKLPTWEMMTPTQAQAWGWGLAHAVALTDVWTDQPGRYEQLLLPRVRAKIEDAQLLLRLRGGGSRVGDT